MPCVLDFADGGNAKELEHTAWLPSVCLQLANYCLQIAYKLVGIWGYFFKAPFVRMSVIPASIFQDSVDEKSKGALSSSL
jgi:hypothetical protein